MSLVDKELIKFTTFFLLFITDYSMFLFIADYSIIFMINSIINKVHCKYIIYNI
jgi:hypothetical protein